MTSNAISRPNPPRFQFGVRTLLGITTATCILLVCLPKTLPFVAQIFLFVMLAPQLAYAAWVLHKSRHQPWALPAETVTVQVDAKWLQRVKSPWILGPIAALTGVSVSFAPAYLLWCGRMEEFGVVEWVAVPICFLIIYFVPGFYMSLASEVIAQLLKSENPQGNSP